MTTLKVARERPQWHSDPKTIQRLLLWIFAIAFALVFLPATQIYAIAIGAACLVLLVLDEVKARSALRRHQAQVKRARADADAQPMRALASPVTLAGGESCICTASARLFTVAHDQTLTASSSGVGMALGGFGLGTARTHGDLTQNDVVRAADAGTFVMTTRRLIFMGAVRQLVIPLSELLAASFYDDALEIRKSEDNSLPVYVVMSIRDAQLAASFLRRLQAGADVVSAG